ncbi:hypothetical protein [Verminephrobacter aporrectodeae]|uniref:Uncharacterized protein n=2 Tax=Verminephrobacter TaxID=364316 RepID=A0ABT3KP72_9BURK|nr:hypothetical protein [Verminephrobacter aporrectodeae]MCW5220934.1 hypothetical protein [Verminephrobacter aporrectodeae subsp. tuberculatae]MCW5255109.1 hypothetical protein [Verminephrobacter aporrectodeae subsp. tuberculatae]MCW5290228.1 hypothetical protein [Verminephrobacter aporrectodeae subsp. tuberculatae]MCW5320121.1 hypothetical protein [Verminephrobacter aporrectodeae subsp. tuberculatae]MCW8177286.1 hypothetical protein [Verminephrobacter aporrectodeae subsp. tuberculatae]
MNMNDLPVGDMLAQAWAMLASHLGSAWSWLQRIWDEAPVPLLLGIVIGLVLARLLRSLLLVIGLIAVAFVVVRMAGISVPGFG